MRRLAALSLSALLAACATPGPVTDPTDPLEATNRQVLDANLVLDRNIFRPVAVLYRNTFGDWTRARLHNALQNVNEPAVAINALLQGDPQMAAQSLLRFVINSIGGLGGMFDLESIGGPPRIVRDFGQTLYVWGVPDGPFLMVPVLGPSNPRELVGVIADGFMNPVTWVIPVEASLGYGAAYGIDQRERNIETLDEIEATSLDLYARLRSLWRQHRDAELGRSTTEAPAVLDDPGAPAVLDDPGAPSR